MKHLYIVTGILLLVCQSVMAGQHSPVTIQINKSAVVESLKVRLGDIAEIESKDKQKVEALSKLVVTQAPRIGYVKKISSQQLEKVIRTSGLSLPRYTLQKNEVLIRSKGQRYEYEPLVIQAEKELRNFLKVPGRELNIRPREHADDIKLPYGVFKFKTRVNANRPKKRMSVWIDVFQNNVFYRSIPVWFDVEAFEKVYVAAKHVQAKQVAEQSDFYIETRDVAKLAFRPFSSRQKVGQFLVNRSLKLDDVLLESDVKPVPAIVRGQLLSVIAREGNVSVTVQGVSRNDAEIGEIIMVKSLQSGSLIKVRVVGREMAEVI